MQLLLNIATLLGGVSATWFLWDKLRDWSRHLPERRSHTGRGDSELPKALEGAMRFVLSVVTVGIGGLGWRSVAVLAQDTTDVTTDRFVLIVATGLLCGYGAIKLSQRYEDDRYEVVKGILTVTGILSLVAVVASFPAIFIVQLLGTVGTPQAAFFYGAGLVTSGILAIWITERRD